MKKIELTVHLDDETVHDIVVVNPTLVAWDRSRVNFKWPKTADAPHLWMTFIAWHHMKAKGLIACEFKEFEEVRCVGVGDTVKAEAEADDEDPTKPAPVAG